MNFSQDYKENHSYFFRRLKEALSVDEGTEKQSDIQEISADTALETVEETAPPNPRLSKKNAFVSRGWGAGGMPFSVLYMKSRANHGLDPGETHAPLTLKEIVNIVHDLSRGQTNSNL